MSLTTVCDLLKALHQEKLVPLIENLSSQDLERLLNALQAVSWETLLQQQAVLQEKIPSQSHFQQPDAFDYIQDCSGIEQKGLQLIQEGKVACIVVAGGQGTRLGSAAPKGCFPISVERKKSLFELIAEKTRSAGDRAGRLLPLIIMTSPDNRKETESFFQKNSLFGLAPEQLYFIQQDTLPFLTPEGELFFLDKGMLAAGPDGNGGSLQVLAKSGILEKLKKQGVKYLNFILVDNPLADPFDPSLVGYHALQKAEVTIKCVERIDETEKVGILVQEKGRVKVKEYSELSLVDQAERFTLANISLFCFSITFAEKTVNAHLPLHAAFKSSPQMLADGTVVKRDEPSIWKFERFIFDLLDFSERTAILVYPRESCFAPLKKLSDLPVIQDVMIRQDRKMMHELTGKIYDTKEIERSYYYLNHDKLMKLKAFPPIDKAYLPGFLEIKNFLS